MGMIQLILFLCTISANDSSMTFIAPDHPDIQYYGRFDFSNLHKPAFYWPGIYLKTAFQGTSCKVILEGRNCYDAFIDGVHTAKLIVGTQADTFTIAHNLTDRTHQLLLVKRSESNHATAFFRGFILDKGKTCIPAAPPPSRKIEFIGDSYTAGFANEYYDRNCPPEKVDSIILSSTNANRAFGSLTAHAFGAQYQIHAYSGKGLIRNYNGIDKGREFLYYYDKVLPCAMEASPNADFSLWKPDVIVIGLGINDFQADPPYADTSEFDSVYSRFLDRLRMLHPGVKLICCATKVWPTDALIPRIKSIVEKQKKQGKSDVAYFEFTSQNTALYGHPGLQDHATIAKSLIPLVPKVTGWNRVDLIRGK